MESLAGKIAVITGGTRGIGRAIAEGLLREGAAVAICGRTQESVTRAVSELRPHGRVFGYPADVTKPSDVHAFFLAVDREFSGLDILVNNAGAAIFRKVADLSVEEWNRNIDLNLNAAFYCSHEAVPRLIQRGGGSIVNISSLAGRNAFSGGAGYNAAKAGLNRFSEALMLDHRQDNIRVCSILPGSVATEFSGTEAKRTEDTAWMIAPEDVAQVCIMVLRVPSRTMISHVEMRPSRPKK